MSKPAKFQTVWAADFKEKKGKSWNQMEIFILAYFSNKKKVRRKRRGKLAAFSSHIWLDFQALAY